MSERVRELEFARARAARRLAKLHPKDFERLTIEELAKTLRTETRRWAESIRQEKKR